MTGGTEERAEEIAALLNDDGVPLDGDEMVFDAPWQARLFGIALAFHEQNEEYEWPEFQDRLVEAVAGADPREMQADVDTVYYERWLAALESFLTDEEILDATEIEQRQGEFSDGKRDASEFVAGDHTH